MTTVTPSVIDMIPTTDYSPLLEICIFCTVALIFTMVWTLDMIPKTDYARLLEISTFCVVALIFTMVWTIDMIPKTDNARLLKICIFCAVALIFTMLWTMLQTVLLTLSSRLSHFLFGTPTQKLPSAHFQNSNSTGPFFSTSLESTGDPVTVKKHGGIYELYAMENYLKTQHGNLMSPYSNAPLLFKALQHNNLIEALVESGVLRGDLVSKWNEDKKKATEVLWKKANNGDEDAMKLVALNHFYGEDGFKKDEQWAHIWLEAC